MTGDEPQSLSAARFVAAFAACVGVLLLLGALIVGAAVAAAQTALSTPAGGPSCTILQEDCTTGDTHWVATVTGMRIPTGTVVVHSSVSASDGWFLQATLRLPPGKSLGHVSGQVHYIALPEDSPPDDNVVQIEYALPDLDPHPTIPAMPGG